MRGIVSVGGYIPYHRLDRREITALFAKGGGRGTRAVASYDEDTTTMGVAAARNALASWHGRGSQAAGGSCCDDLWFVTSSPAYLEKTNATAIHAALRFAPQVGALDFGGAVRSGIGSLRTALVGTGTTLVVAADTRDGMATSLDEATVGDAAAAVVVGDQDVIAEYLGHGVATDEILDRWCLPGARRSRTWEQRHGEVSYARLLRSAWQSALDATGLKADDIDRLAVTGVNIRAIRRNTRLFGPASGKRIDDFADTIGNTATAHPALLLTSAIESAGPGEIIALVAAADGVEVVMLRTTEAIGAYRAEAPLAEQIKTGAPIDYGTFLSWRDMVTVEPPNRPPPNRPSASAGYRRRHWKFGFVGSRDRSSAMVHLPPARVSEKGGAVDDMEPVPMAGTTGAIVSFTVDRLVYSPSPPVVFAIVDFDGGGRSPLELTDVLPCDVAVGGRVEPTFRRLFTADGIHNYFWKVRPVLGSNEAAASAVDPDAQGA